MGPENTFHSRWGCDSASFLGVGQLGSKASKIPHFRIWIRLICTPLNSLIREYPWLGSADEQSCWLTIQIWTVFQDMYAGCCKSLPTSLSQILSDWALQILLQFPWCEIRVKGPTKWPTMLGGAGSSPWLLFSHWRNQGPGGDLSKWCYTGPGGRQLSQRVATSLTLQKQSVTPSAIKEGA